MFPERVGLAFEQSDNNAAMGREGAQGAAKEGHEELLIVANLTVDIGGFAADMGEIEEDVIVDGAGYGRRKFSGVY